MREIKIDRQSVLNADELVQLMKREVIYYSNTLLYISKLTIQKLLEDNDIIWEEVIDDTCVNNEMAYLICWHGSIIQIHVIESDCKYFQILFFASKGVLYKYDKIANKIVIKI